MNHFIIPLDPNQIYAPWVHQYGLQFRYGSCQCGCGKEVPVAKRTRPNRGWAIGEPIRFVAAGHSNSPRTLQGAFDRHVTPGSPEECWFWSGDAAHYGKVKLHGRWYVAHRLSYELHNGPIPDDLIVCHSCDRPGCVNPGHLFVGTYKDNSSDMIQKGRNKNGAVKGRRIQGNEPPHPLGENSPRSTLTNAQVIAIRQRAASGESLTNIAKDIRASVSNVCAIVNRKAWKHI